MEPLTTGLQVPRGRGLKRLEIGLRHCTPRKLLNLLRVEMQLRLGKTKVAGYPYEWEIDTTNICQLRCPLCHTGLGNVNRVKGFMPFELYQKVIDEIKPYTLWLSLYSWGEPLAFLIQFGFHNLNLIFLIPQILPFYLKQKQPFLSFLVLAHLL